MLAGSFTGAGGAGGTGAGAGGTGAGAGTSMVKAQSMVDLESFRDSSDAAAQ